MPIQDVVSELNRIQNSGLISGYAIGGAVAAGAYIEATQTEDVDVFVIFGDRPVHPLAPLREIWADLISNGAQVQGEYLVIGGWPVQLLPPGTPIYDDAIASARTKDFGGVDGKIMGPEHLAAIALATGRGKDYVRVAEFIRTGKLDPTILNQLIDQFGLADRWKEFQTRFPTNTNV
jgi:hypothetical protein